LSQQCKSTVQIFDILDSVGWEWCDVLFLKSLPLRTYHQTRLGRGQQVNFVQRVKDPVANEELSGLTI
jgi:hypothetical protein